MYLTGIVAPFQNVMNEILLQQNHSEVGKEDLIIDTKVFGIVQLTGPAPSPLPLCKSLLTNPETVPNHLT
jgi:hypothetical protein